MRYHLHHLGFGHMRYSRLWISALVMAISWLILKLRGDDETD